MSEQPTAERVAEIKERAGAGTKNNWFVPKNARQIVFSETQHPLVVARCEDEADATIGKLRNPHGIRCRRNSNEHK